MLNVLPRSSRLDPLHPQWFAEEVKETLMNNPNTRDNMCNDTKIEFFCREIQKTYDKENPFFKKQNKHICWFSNSLKETDNEKLRNALNAELYVLIYLMGKHKNSRARVFYDSIFVPTLNKFIEKCGIDGENIADNKTDKSNTQGLKNYLDNINKELIVDPNVFGRLKQQLIELGDGKEDTLHSIKKGAEILKYVIDNHRHKRGINFAYAYNYIINGMLDNNVSECKGV